MKKPLSLLFVLLFTLFSYAQKKYVLVIHGGAGTITKENLTPEKEKEYREALALSLKAGYEKIKEGKTSLEAVEASILVMEDSPLFNAGKGAVLTAEGTVELDASFMQGKDLNAGAVAGVMTIKNPIKAAIAVMNHSPHVMLMGRGAEAFARTQNLELVSNEYFKTPSRMKSLELFLELEKRDPQAFLSPKDHAELLDQKYGTVGAVALDLEGNISAGTSTGGMTGKKWNRVGDSPLIGAGTYANKQVGISGTGWGEYFIRTTAARSLAAQMEYLNLPVEKAAENVIDQIAALGGDGGLIALDQNGNVAMTFNTKGMYRGAVTEDGDMEIYIYR